MKYLISHTLFIGKDTIFLPMCHSTNDMAAGLLKENKIKEGAVVITDEQVAGRGQRGASWESQPEKNLTFSVVFEPDFLQPVQNFFLTIFTSLGLTDTLLNISPDFKIKWPNDIFYNNRKVCGMLIENSIKGKFIKSSVAGIGLNVNQKEFKTPGAISLSKIAQKEFDKNRLLNEVLKTIEARYLQLKAGRFDELRSEYLERLYWIGEKRLFFDHHYFEGTITGVSSTGRLIIDADGAVREYDFKEVKFIQ